MLSEYRQRFVDYRAEQNREEFLFLSGRKKKWEGGQTFSEYSDLFRLEAVDELRALLEETPSDRLTDISSIKRLIAFALEGNVLSRVREIDAQIEAGDEDLRAERFEKLQDAARSLGYVNYLVFRQAMREIDYEALAAKAMAFLSRTEESATSALKQFFAREFALPLDSATPAELSYLKSFRRLDHFFPHEQMIKVYRELFAGLGFNSDRQPNIEIEIVAEPRPRNEGRPDCYPIRIPEEIKIIAGTTGGQRIYRRFLRAAGHAQNYAWTSRNLKYEFRIGGDRAVIESWGMLFDNLRLDKDWLLRTQDFAESLEFRQTAGLQRLLAIRRQAAKLNYEVEFHSGKVGNAGPRYAELLTGATGIRIDESEYLRDLSDTIYPADFFRASAFESQLREYLKTKFGTRWWASSKAGEMLIDLWNTGQRYQIDELASMIGLGELDFDWLATEFERKWFDR
jgi:hypothetical protein